MIKIAPPGGNAFSSFKCGEIFCISPAVFNVTCCLCAGQMHLQEFSCHFQIQHLALVEESIDLETLECKKTTNIMKDVNIEGINIKDDPEDDPIKHEDLILCSNKATTNLEQLKKKTEKANHKLENVQKPLATKPEVNALNIDENPKVETFTKKPKTRNSKRSKIKDDVKEFEDPNDDELKGTNFKEIKIEFDSNKEESHVKGFGNCEDEMDGDWLEEYDASKTDSEADNDKDELPYPCHTCKRSYRSKHGLQKHNQIVHNPNKKGPKRPKDPKPIHKCDQCDEVFRIARDLRAHKWKHTGIFCDICGKPFTQTSNLMRHKLRHTGIKDHKCKECGKEFFTDKELKSHMICHTGLMPVICEICGKQCRHRGVLTAHMRRHTGERPAKCDVCGKCFFSIHDLNVHAVAHTNLRPFKCDICGSTFQRKKALRVHKLIHSKDRKHVCKICGKGFAQSGGLKSHMRTHNAALENPPNLELASAITTSTCKTTNNPGPVISPENSILEQYIN